MIRGKWFLVLGGVGVALVVAGLVLGRHAGGSGGHARAGAGHWVVADAQGQRLYSWTLEGTTLDVRGPNDEPLARLPLWKDGLAIVDAGGAVTGCMVMDGYSFLLKDGHSRSVVEAGSAPKAFEVTGLAHSGPAEYAHRELKLDGTVYAARRTGKNTWAVTRDGKKVLEVRGPGLDAEVALLALDRLQPIFRLALLDARGRVPGTPTYDVRKVNPNLWSGRGLRPFINHTDPCPTAADLAAKDGGTGTPGR